jgi:hypothetical protein
MSDFHNDRTSPWARQLPLWLGFLLVTVAAIVTVVGPALTDDDDPEETPPATEPR